MDPSRRGFLRGRLSPAPLPARPPWALAEAGFLEQCSRCGDCSKVCETQIIRLGPGGFPVLDFSHGGCTYCRRCLDTCQPKALIDTGKGPWVSQNHPKALIGNHCLAHKQVECRSCGEHCPVEAIRFFPRPGNASLPVVQGSCDGCGQCIKPCPANAISLGKPLY